MRHQLLLLLLISTIFPACVNVKEQSKSTEEILIFGTSGRIGGYLTEEALLRGYQVTGVSRRPDKLQEKFPTITAVKGDILDRPQLRTLLNSQKIVLVSVGGKPTSPAAEEYIAYTAALSLIEVLTEIGAAGPRVIFVGNVFTLNTESGESMLERGKGHPTNYPMFKGHQLALDAFRASTRVNWSIATPPNGFRFKDRTEKVRFGDDTLLLDADGKPASISLEDYAFGIFEEIQSENHLGQRFTIAR